MGVVRRRRLESTGNALKAAFDIEAYAEVTRPGWIGKSVRGLPQRGFTGAELMGAMRRYSFGLSFDLRLGSTQGDHLSCLQTRFSVGFAQKNLSKSRRMSVALWA